ncbi:MAG: LamG domain-containing protein [Gammaproteobacteria bacterium]|nr:LamG domain-containing protein [Gammaproteobacteria bacterium]
MASELGTDTTDEDLTSTAQNTADADGDDVKNIFNWHKDTNPIQVLNMPFEGGSDGASTRDYSDSANNGTVTGATWNATGGHDGKGAYEFDGTNDYIGIYDGSELEGYSDTQFTLSLWIKPADIVTNRYVAHGENKRSLIIGYQDGYVNIYNASYPTGDATDTQIPVTVGAWQHIVYTTDGTSLQGYKNGALMFDETANLNTTGIDYYTLGVNNPGSNFFQGALDDFEIYNVHLSAEQVTNLYNGDENIIDSEETTSGDTWQSCVTPNDGTVDGATKCSNVLDIIDVLSIDHIEILNDGNGLTCLEESITVKACADAACSSVATTDVEVTLSAIGGSGATTWSNNPVMIPANSSSGVIVTFTHRTAETITLSATTSPAATNNLVCNYSGCDLVFSDAGYVLSLMNHNSCSTAKLEIEAVQLGTAGLACAPAYTGDQSVNFSYEYMNPSTGSTVPILDSSNMAAEKVAQSRTITFDNTASATLDFEYRDAGLLRITVADNAAAGLASAVVDTIVKPAKLIVSTSDADNECTGSDFGACTKFKVAGTETNIPSQFNLTVAGACSDSTVTPNFQLSTIPLSLTLVAPSGGSDGALAVSSVDITSGGTETVTQAITEVGVFTITAIPPEYLGLYIPVTTSANIGRFIPHRFTVSANTPSFAASTCNFTYQGQPFGFAPGPMLTVTAVNSAGATTLNYGGDGKSNNDFWKLDSTKLSARTYTNQVATFPGAFNYSRGGVIVDHEKDYNGMNTFAFPDDLFTYIKAGVVPVPGDAQFEATVQLNILAEYLTDSDDVSYDTDLAGDTPDDFDITNINGTNIRWGRWHIANAFGSELQDLPMVAEAQYFNGANFVLNTNDSSTGGCTTFTPLTLLPVVNLSDYTDNLSSGDTALPSPIPNISDGLVTFSLSAPGSGNDGSVLITITAPIWFTYDFNYDGTADNASARATFGIFEGREPVIIKRQTY